MIQYLPKLIFLVRERGLNIFHSAEDYVKEDQRAIIQRSQTISPQSIRLKKDLFRLQRTNQLLISRELKQG